MLIEKPNTLTKQAVGCILTHKKKYLLLHRTKDKLWGSLAGNIHANETPQHAIVREGKEELGITLKPNILATTYHKYGAEIVAYHLFEQELASEDLLKIRLNQESSEYRFLSIEQAQKLVLYEDEEYCLLLHEKSHLANYASTKSSRL